MRFAIKPAESLPFVTLVALVVGSWIGSAHTLLADILRFAQSSKHAVTVAAIAIMVGNPLMILIGAVGALATGQGDLSSIFAVQGLMVPFFLIMVVNNWTAGQGCAYSGALTLSSVTKMSHRTATAIIGAIGLVMGLMGFFDHFGGFILTLSRLTLRCGVFIADYLVTYKQVIRILNQTESRMSTCTVLSRC